MNGYTDTSGTGGGWADVISAGISAWSQREAAQEATKQADAYSQVWRYQDAQAKAASYTQTANSSATLKTLLMVGGLLVAGLVIYKVAK